MLAVVRAGTLVGIDALPVQVEVDFAPGLPGLDIIGLPEAAVRESRVRVKAALQANGYTLPPRRLVVNMAPGDLRKKGACFDLAIAVALLAACGHCAPNGLEETLFLGELSLSGRIRPVRGALAQLRSARHGRLARAVIPAGNADEGSLAVGLDVRVAGHLREVLDFLEGRSELPAARPGPTALPEPSSEPDLRDVRGQESARRALEIAAAGGHHILMVGPPGAGKTMLARRLPGLLPPPDAEEALEMATIAGVAGLLLDGRRPRRPFRAPHHTASTAALVGGGEPIRPGEVTLAHGGVLFLDELPEFRRDAVESLRVTLESGVAVVARARERVAMPARPLIVAAMNPCPCGHDGDPGRVCLCPPDRVARYRARVSGPLLDRFDMHVVVPRVRTSALREARDGEPTAEVRARVAAVRSRAGRRPWREGVPVDGLGIERAALSLLDEAVEKLGLSARGYVKVLKVARTIADLGGNEATGIAEVAEALQYRLLDRRTEDRSRIAGVG